MSFLRFLHPPSQRRYQGWGRPMKGYSLNKYIILLIIIYFNKIKHLSLGLPFGYHWPMAWIIPSLPCHRDTPCKKVKRSKSRLHALAGISLAPRRWEQKGQEVKKSGGANPRLTHQRKKLVVRLTCDSVGIGSCHTCPPHARSPRSARLKTASSRFNPHSDRVKLKPSGGTFLGRHVNSRIGFVCPH